MAACLLTLLIVVTAKAHDPGLSAAEIGIGRESIEAQLALSGADAASLIQVDRDGDGRISSEELEAERVALEALALGAFEVLADGVAVDASGPQVSVDEAGGILLRARYRVSLSSEVGVRSLLISRLPRGHRQYCTIKERSKRVLSETLLDSSGTVVSASVASDRDASSLKEASAFLLLGVEHILTGFDHLAFLLGLLLVGGGFRDAAKIITAFTVAHSVTLALSVFDLVRASPGLVEPLIAASIVYIGLDNLLRDKVTRRRPRWRWLIAFGFGLVHGFGFATALRELGIGAGDSSALASIVPLVSFNLGVEAGQIAIAAMVLPLIWRLRTRPAFGARYAPACSILIAIAGGYWLVERIMG
jgi:hydrogenase/urease accessory protein HupE